MYDSGSPFMWTNGKHDFDHDPQYVLVGKGSRKKKNSGQSKKPPPPLSRLSTQKRTVLWLLSDQTTEKIFCQT